MYILYVLKKELEDLITFFKIENENLTPIYSRVKKEGTRVNLLFTILSVQWLSCYEYLFSGLIKNIKIVIIIIFL